MTRTIFNSQQPGFEANLSSIDPSGPIGSHFGNLVYEAVSGEDTCKIVFSFDPEKEDISVIIDISATLKVSCILTCGIALVGPILDCYRKNKKNWGGFKKCLEEQGNTLGATTVACILTCMP